MAERVVPLESIADAHRLGGQTFLFCHLGHNLPKASREKLNYFFKIVDR